MPISQPLIAMLNGTNLIKGRWKIIKAIGAGAFGMCGELFSIPSRICGLVAIMVDGTRSKNDGMYQVA